MILVLYFFMWRPNRSNASRSLRFRASLKKGDKIITAGGIYGVVKEIKETTLLYDEVTATSRSASTKTWSSPTRATCSSNSRNKKVYCNKRTPFPVIGKGVLHTIIRSSPEINSKTKPAGQNQKPGNQGSREAKQYNHKQVDFRCARKYSDTSDTEIQFDSFYWYI